MDFNTLIGTVGFAGTCMVFLAIWVDKQIKNNREDTQKTIDILREDSKEDKKVLFEVIADSKEVNSKLLATNELLVKDVIPKLDKVLEKVGE